MLSSTYKPQPPLSSTSSFLDGEPIMSCEIKETRGIDPCLEATLKQYIASIPNFPIPGIDFKDIAPLIAEKDGFSLALDSLCNLLSPIEFDAVVAIESRGFLIGAPVAHQFRTGLILVRKPGKLPGEKDLFPYTCEYCSGELEVQRGAIRSGARYLVLDDLLATGGTSRATADYIALKGGIVAGFCFLVELSMLNGKALLVEAPVVSLLKY